MLHGSKKGNIGRSSAKALLQSSDQSSYKLNSPKGTHEYEGDGGGGGAADRWVFGGDGAGKSREKAYRVSGFFFKKQ